MELNQENFSDRGRNEIQVELAAELYGGTVRSGDEMLTRWVNDGYAKRFDEYLKKHPEAEEEIFLNDDKEALEKLKKEILFH